MSPARLPGPGKPVQPGPRVDLSALRGVRRELPTAADTRAFGAALAVLLQPGDVVILDGPLGAGKTTFAQGVGAGLGLTERVTSPTFVIARTHRSGRVPLVHVDAYRLGSVAEVDDLDLDADLEQSVTLVEWGGGVAEQLAPDRLVVHLDREAAGDGETRIARLVGSTRWMARLAALDVSGPGA